MNVQIRFWNENLSEVQTHYLNSKLLKWQNAGWHVVWASWSKWCITPRINDHAFHGWTKYQLEILWSFKISMYWERVSPNYWCWFMWITCGARSLSDLHESQWLEIGKHFKGLKRSLPSDEHFRCFSMRFCQTCWVEDEPVAIQAIEVSENVVNVIKHFQTLLCKSKQLSKNNL